MKRVVVNYGIWKSQNFPLHCSFHILKGVSSLRRSHLIALEQTYEQIFSQLWLVFPLLVSPPPHDFSRNNESFIAVSH